MIVFFKRNFPEGKLVEAWVLGFSKNMFVGQKPAELNQFFELHQMHNIRNDCLR